ncbi:hypothetical protein CBL_06059 [Carabus blaptoides fortunei]
MVCSGSSLDRLTTPHPNMRRLRQRMILCSSGPRKTGVISQLRSHALCGCQSTRRGTRTAQEFYKVIHFESNTFLQLSYNSFNNNTQSFKTDKSQICCSEDVSPVAQLHMLLYDVRV